MKYTVALATGIKQINRSKVSKRKHPVNLIKITTKRINSKKTPVSFTYLDYSSVRTSCKEEKMR